MWAGELYLVKQKHFYSVVLADFVSGQKNTSRLMYRTGYNPFGQPQDMWGSCSLIYPELLITLHCYVKSSRKYRWMSDKHTTFCETEGLCVWESGQQHRFTSGDCTLTVSLHSVHLGLPLQLWVYRNTQMTLQLLGVSVMNKKLSTGNWTITSILKTIKTKLMIVDFRRTRN